MGLAALRGPNLIWKNVEAMKRFDYIIVSYAQRGISSPNGSDGFRGWIEIGRMRIVTLVLAIALEMHYYKGVSKTRGFRNLKSEDQLGGCNWAQIFFPISFI